MKKTILFIIHTLSVLLFAAGLSVIYMISPEGFGLSWISERDFAESAIFAEMVNEDIADIKEFALLRDAFETDGEVSYDKVVVTAETSNGFTSYTLRQLSNIAAQYGCTMDPDTHRVSISNVTPSEDVINYQLKISVKSYDPDYYKNRPQGPGQGIMNLRDLAIEVVQELAKYYSYAGIYESWGSNFSYSLHYLDADGEYRDLYNSDRSGEDLLTYGKYLYVQGSGTNSIDTNIYPIPSNAYDTGTDSDMGPVMEEDEYQLIIGIDTTFPYEDRYSRAADSYNREVDMVYMGIAMLAAGAVVALVSLILLFRLDPGTEGKKLLHPVDSLYLEVHLLIILALGFFILRASEGIASFIISVLADAESFDFFYALVRTLIVYAVGIYVLRILVRRYNGGVFWTNTLLHRICGMIADFADHGKLLSTLISGYLLIILINAGSAAALMYCLRMRFESTVYMIAFCVILILMLVLNVLIFTRIYKQDRQREEIGTALKLISMGETQYEMQEEDFSGRELGVVKDINNISKGLSRALNDQVKSERLRADLITNVSHDIRTPLTSIINYVDLLKRENIQNEKVRDYIDILDKKSDRLKNLTEDLLEASKASSGNIKMDMEKIDLVEISMQAGAEFEDKFAARSLELCLDAPETPVYIYADGRHLWRVLENLYNNAAKYALEGTRIYADIITENDEHIFTIKNVSRDKLNISPDELTERFVRGDESRHTEGSGLGLSIAQSLTRLMGGRLEIVIDGDLYKANIHFPIYEEAVKSSEAGVQNGANLIELISEQE